MTMQPPVHRAWHLAALVVGLLPTGCAASETLSRTDGEEIRVRTVIAWDYQNTEEIDRRQQERIQENIRAGRPAGPHWGVSGKEAAFAAKNRAVVLWSVTYDCGLTPSPTVAVNHRTIRLGVTFGS